MSGKGRYVVAGFLGLLASDSFGTMILSAMARQPVGVVAQCNTVIWDPETKTEHLIQSSAIYSQAQRFEILIPTPTVPKVKEVGNKPIDFLTGLVHPPRPIAEPIMPNPDDELDPDFGTLIRGKVEVKQITFVGNLKATTIRTSDVIALSDWMTNNGYKANAAQNKWLETYVQKRWFVTALQVNSESEALKTSAVRLSFKTNIPVVPYTSPQRSWLSGIRQELFLVSPTPLVGSIGGKFAWGGRLMDHAFVSSEATKGLAKSLGVAVKDIPARAWVDRYLDVSDETAAVDDLYFLPKPKGIKR